MIKYQMIEKFIGLHHEKNGQAMAEFVIVFFPLFLLFLLILQMALLVTAKQVIQYSAFCAARGAIVYDGSRTKSEQAARLACMSISPRLTQTNMQEIINFAQGLGNTAVDLSGYAVNHPEWAGLDLVIDWDEIPGIEVLNRLRNTNVNDYYIIDADLSDGLSFIDQLCGDHRHEIPMRYPSASLLMEHDIIPSRNGNDVTVKLKYNYAMQIPIINKMFFLMYLTFNVRSTIESHFSSYPGVLMDQIGDSVFNALNSLSDHSLYFLPIVADCTLTIEKYTDGIDEIYCNP